MVNPRRIYTKKFSGPSAEGGIPEFARPLANIVDTKVVLARKLHKMGKTCGEMAGALGYSSAHSCATFLKTLGLKPNLTPPTKRTYTEEERRLRSERMVQYFKEHPIHQNDWSKKMEVRVKYPKWHEEAREMRKAGKSNIEIAKHFKVSSSRVSQVTNDRWEEYAQRDLIKGRNMKERQKKDDEAMADRMFEIFHSRNPQEKRNGVIVRCSHPGCETSDLFMKQGIISPVHAARTFRNRGWLIGGGMKSDTCPYHAGNTKSAPQGSTLVAPAVTKPVNTGSDWAKANAAAAFKEGTMLSGGLVKNIKTSADKEPAIIANQADKIHEEQKAAFMDATLAPQPHVNIPIAGIETVIAPVKSTDTMTPMSKADRRLIFAKLNEVYEDDGSQYKDDWSDEKVATDMGCPVLWVAEVRDADFGPNTNALSAKALLTAKQVEEIKELARQVATSQGLVDKALDAAAAATEAFDKAVAAFNEKLENFKGQVA